MERSGRSGDLTTRKRARTTHHDADGEGEEDQLNTDLYQLAVARASAHQSELKSHLRLGHTLTDLQLPRGMALLIASVESSFSGLALTPELAKTRLSEGVLVPFLGHPGSQVLTHNPGCFESVMHKMLAMVAPLWLLPRAAALGPVLFSFAIRVAGCYKQYPGLRKGGLEWRRS